MKVSKKKPIKKIQKPKRVSLTELVCVLSGKTEKVNLTKLTKLATKFKFETTEEYVKYFICKDCIKLLRQGYTEKQIQKQFNYESDIQIPFNVLKHYVKKFKNRAKIEKLEKRKEVLKYMEDKPGAYIVTQKARQTVDFTNKEQVADLTRDACWRPDIYLNNDRACNGCYLYEHCKCAIRRWDDPNEKRTRKKK